MDLINNPWFVLVLGMGTVFIGLFLLVLIIKVMGLIAGKTVKTPAAPAAAAAAPAAETIADDANPLAAFLPLPRLRLPRWYIRMRWIAMRSTPLWPPQSPPIPAAI